MSVDTLRPSRMTMPCHEMFGHVEALIAESRLDCDPVSVFVNGSSWTDAEGVVFVVKDAAAGDRLVVWLEQQGLLTPGKGVRG